MPTFRKNKGFNMKNKGNFDFGNTGSFDFRKGEGSIGDAVTMDDRGGNKKKKKKKKSY